MLNHNINTKYLNKFGRILVFSMFILLSIFISLSLTYSINVTIDLSPINATCQDSGGTWSSANCDDTSYTGVKNCGSNQETTYCDDSSVESQTYNRDTSGGARMFFKDMSQSLCEHILKVEVLYDVWSSPRRGTGNINIDADGDGYISVATISASSDGTTNTLDVTSSLTGGETWDCSDFFSSSANATLEAFWPAPSTGPPSTYNILTDQLIYRVTYNYSVGSGPLILTGLGSYYQDNIVFINGSNWENNAVVSINITRNDSTIDVMPSETADGSGNFNLTYDIGPYYVDGTYTIFAVQDNDSSINSTWTFNVLNRSLILNSDKTYYSPGQKINFTGSGFAGNIFVNVSYFDGLGVLYSPYDFFSNDATDDIEYNYTVSNILHLVTGSYSFNFSENNDSSYFKTEDVEIVFRPTSSISGTLSNVNESDGLFDTFGGGGTNYYEFTFGETLLNELLPTSMSIGIEYTVTGAPSMTLDWYNDTSATYQSTGCSLPNSPGTVYCDITNEVLSEKDWNSVRLRLGEAGGGGDFGNIDFVFLKRNYSVIPLNVTSINLNATSIDNLTLDNLTCSYTLDNLSNTSVVNWLVDSNPITIINMPFEGNSTNALKDYSGNGYNGVNYGALWNFSTGNPEGYGGFVFTDNNEYINTSWYPNPGNYSMSMWIYWYSITNYYATGTHDQSGHRFYIGINGNNVYYGAGNSWSNSCAHGMSANTWNFITMTINGSHAKYYVNGTEVCSFGYSWVGQATETFTIGNMNGYGFDVADRTMDAVIDSLVVYNRTLTPNQINSLYTNGLSSIVFEETVEGENWQCSITPFSQYFAGSSFNSNSILINGITPKVTSISLNATTLGNLTEDNLTCNYNINSLSSTSVVNWFRNGTTFELLNMPFEGNLTNALADYSGVEANGTNNGATWNANAGRDGNGAFIFTDSGDYIDVGIHPEYDLTDQFTISAWINASSSGPNDYQTIINKEDSGGAYQDRNFWLDLWTDGTLNLRFSTTTGGITDCDVKGSVDLRDGIWHHVVGVYNGTHCYIYLDGSLHVTPDSVTGTPEGQGDPLYIGVEVGNMGRGFDGMIDEVKIYNDTLSKEQIETLYNGDTNIIVSNETKTNETWQCSVTPFNNLIKGNTTFSNDILIKENNTIKRDLKVDKRIYNINQDQYVVVIDIKNQAWKTTNTVLYDFVSDSFTYGSFNNMYNGSYSVTGTHTGDILYWNLSLNPSQNITINYSISGVGDYNLLDNHIIGLE